MQAGESVWRYDTCACRNPVSLNLGRQMGVQLSADLKLVEASTRFSMRWTSGSAQSDVKQLRHTINLISRERVRYALELN